MKTIILNLIKRVNHFTNELPSPGEEADIILKYLLLKNNTERSIDIFENLEAKFQSEMKKRESEASSICRLVNAKYKKNPSTLIIADPAFDQPIKQA